MRVLLLYNPNATRTGLAVAEQVADRLGSAMKVDVEATKRRDHASYLAAGAAHEGYEAVAVLGGDGTINEVVQGLVGTDVRLAVLPGGSTNVFARTLGLPNDVLAAADLTRQRLLEHQHRRIGLGLANGRYFTFHAGFGYDAEVVRMVEARARMKRAVRQATFIWCGILAALHTTANAAEVSLVAQPHAPAGSQEAVRGLVSAVCCASDPYTYLGPIPVRLLPQASVDRGLELLGLHQRPPPDDAGPAGPRHPAPPDHPPPARPHVARRRPPPPPGRPPSPLARRRRLRRHGRRPPPAPHPQRPHGRRRSGGRPRNASIGTRCREALGAGLGRVCRRSERRVACMVRRVAHSRPRCVATVSRVDVTPHRSSGTPLVACDGRRDLGTLLAQRAQLAQRVATLTIASAAGIWIDGEHLPAQFRCRRVRARQLGTRRVVSDTGAAATMQRRRRRTPSPAPSHPQLGLDQRQHPRRARDRRETRIPRWCTRAKSSR